jgi:hypothetical protein
MDERLSTPTCLLGRFGPLGSFESGELTLANGVVTFTSRERAEQGHVFSAPFDTVKARFPKLYSGLGLQLVVNGTRYRLWFVPLRSAVGETMGIGEDERIVAGNTFDLKELGPARSTSRMWRTALSRARA